MLIYTYDLKYLLKIQNYSEYENLSLYNFL